MNSFFDKPIFILGCHKSGTSLLRSLLDGHSQLFCMPKEIHFFQASGFQIQYPIRSQPAIPLHEMFSPRLYRNFLRTENNQRSRFSDNSMFSFKIDQFYSDFLSQSDDGSLVSRFKRYMNAILSSSQMKPQDSDKCLVEKSVENFEFFPLLLNMFPKARFIHIVRNPYAILSAIRQMKHYRNYPRIFPFCMAIDQSFRASFLSFLYSANYRVLRYEDLVSESKETMNNICKFLEIPFEEVVLSPTINGQKWVGNSVSCQEFTGISAARISEWENEINPLEVAMVNKFLSPHLCTFSYSPFEKGNSASLIKSESFQTYMLNRLQLWLPLK